MNSECNSIFDEIRLLNLLNDLKKCSNLIDARYYKKSTNILELDDLESFIVNNYNNKKYISLIKKYTSFIFDKYKENKYIAYDSILFKDKNIDYLFNGKQANEIKNFKKLVSYKSKRTISNLEDNTRVNDMVLRYAIDAVGEESLYLTKLYRYLLNNIRFNTNKLAYEFILKYTAYLSSKELNVKDYKLYFNNYDMVKSVYLDSYGKSYPSLNVIFLNSDKLKEKDSILYLMHTAAHEMKHLNQYNRYKNNEISEITFHWLIHDIIANNKEEYDKNYDNLEIEMDANDYGWDLLSRIFSSYSKNNRYAKFSLIKKNEVLLEKLVNYKCKESNMDCVEDIDYNVKQADEAVRNKPNYIQKYGILGYIYDVTGKRNTIYNLLFIEKTLLKRGDRYKNIKDIFRMYYLYEIKKGNMFNLERLSIQTKKDIIIKYIELATQELEDINQIVTLNRLSKSIDYTRVNRKIKSKLSIVSNLMSFLYKNSREIYKIKDRLLITKLNKLLVLIDRLDVKVNTNIINKIIYEKNTYDIQLSGYKLQKSLR